MTARPRVANISPYEMQCGSYTVTFPDAATTTAPSIKVTTNNTTAFNIIIPLNIDVPYKQDNVDRGIKLKSVEVTYAVATQNATITPALYSMPTNSTTTTMTALSTSGDTFTGTAAATYQKKINTSYPEIIYTRDKKLFLKLAITPVSGAVIDVYNAQVIYEMVEDTIL